MRRQRTSRITGHVERVTMLGSWVAVPLCDGAAAVQAWPRYDMRAQVATVMGDGRVSVTYVHCGPGAHLPGGYSEQVGRANGETRYVIREDMPDGRVRLWTKPYHGDSSEAAWSVIRAQYARETGQ